MLARAAGRVLISAAATLLFVVTALVEETPPAHATGGHLICLDDSPSTSEECEVKAWVETEPNGDLQVELATGGGGILEQCRRPRRSIFDARKGPEFADCNGRSLGWYSQKYDCYFAADNDAAQAKDPLDDDVRYPPGVEPGDEGTVYWARCYLEHYAREGGWIGGEFYFLPPSEEPGPTEDPTVSLIVQALDNLLLRAPTIGTAPPADSPGLVRLPVWLWNEVDERNWGTRTAEASAAGITAQAEAVATGITWDMGDGTEIECDEGTAFHETMDWREPPCGHQYLGPSRDEPDGRYPITAVTTWEVEWSVNGPSAASGTVTLLPEAATDLEIQELQVLFGTL